MLSAIDGGDSSVDALDQTCCLRASHLQHNESLRNEEGSAVVEKLIKHRQER